MNLFWCFCCSWSVQSGFYSNECRYTPSCTLKICSYKVLCLHGKHALFEARSLSLFDGQESSGSCSAVALYQLCSLISICSEEKYMFTFLVFMSCNDKLSTFPQNHPLCDRYLKLHLAIIQVLARLSNCKFWGKGAEKFTLRSPLCFSWEMFSGFIFLLFGMSGTSFSMYSNGITVNVTGMLYFLALLPAFSSWN